MQSCTKERPGLLIRLSWGCRSQVLFWSKADTGPSSRRCQHLAAALCTGVQPRVHHRRVGSHLSVSLVLFQIRSGRWRRHKKVAETRSYTHSVFLRPGPIKVHPTWLLLVQVPVLTTVSAPAWKITTGSLSALALSSADSQESPTHKTS